MPRVLFSQKHSFSMLLPIRATVLLTVRGMHSLSWGPIGARKLSSDVPFIKQLAYITRSEHCVISCWEGQSQQKHLTHLHYYFGGRFVSQHLLCRETWGYINYYRKIRFASVMRDICCQTLTDFIKSSFAMIPPQIDSWVHARALITPRHNLLSWPARNSWAESHSGQF